LGKAAGFKGNFPPALGQKLGAKKRAEKNWGKRGSKKKNNHFFGSFGRPQKAGKTEAAKKLLWPPNTNRHSAQAAQALNTTICLNLGYDEDCRQDF
jgi:hypothetical protein